MISHTLYQRSSETETKLHSENSCSSRSHTLYQRSSETETRRTQAITVDHPVTHYIKDHQKLKLIGNLCRYGDNKSGALVAAEAVQSTMK